MPDEPKSNNTEYNRKGDIWGGNVYPEALPKPRPGGQRRRYTQAEVIEALRHARGLKTMAARQLGCAHATVVQYCRKYAAVQAECEAQIAALVDTASLQLIAAVSRGDWKAIEFTLRTLGRGEGYAERHEVTGKDGGPIEHAHIHVWEEHLQRAHARIAAHKEAIRLERGIEGVYERPVDTA